MKRYIIAAISILAFAASMVSCTDHKVIRQLNDVEAYLNEHPDSALTVLDSISTAGIQGRKANARFALLYSMALDKKHIYLTSDSLIMPAVTYYRNHGTDSDRAKSWYYLGRVQQNAGEYIQATVSLTHAEKYADLSGDSFYSGMTHRAMGDIFGDTFNSSESLKYYELAYSDFEKAGARKHSDYIKPEHGNIRIIYVWTLPEHIITTINLPNARQCVILLLILPELLGTQYCIQNALSCMHQPF